MPFFVMELVPGPTLREGPARAITRRSSSLACQVCEALEHAHAHGLVHRDLKPGNLLLVAARGRR